MKYHDNWPEAEKRWRALWEHRHVDRPCMLVTAPLEPRPAMSEPTSGEQRFLDPDYVIPAALARMRTTYWAGEAIPSNLMLAGWTATCYGSTPHFELDTGTIWFDTLEVNWDDPPSFDLDFENVWFRRYEQLHRAMLEAAGRDDFLVGQVCLLPGDDMLSMLLGTEHFLMSLVERPQWVRGAILKTARNWVAVQKHIAEIAKPIHDYWYGNAGWAPFWTPEPYVSTQSDVSCMLSPRMFDEFILPGLDLLGREYGAVWYHLDGPGALQHLPRLCSLDYIKVIQWVPGSGAPPNGPAWMDVYRKIQAASKIVDISVPLAHAEEIVRTLDPSLLCLRVGGCKSAEEADDLLESAVRWTRG